MDEACLGHVHEITVSDGQVSSTVTASLTQKLLRGVSSTRGLELPKKIANKWLANTSQVGSVMVTAGSEHRPRPMCGRDT